MAEAGADPQGVIRLLAQRHLTLATCESLTGGGVCAALTSVPGASAVVRGGIVTYASDLKAKLVGVDAGWIRDHGVINPQTAEQMALGTLEVCGVDVAASCTGVAGPDPQDGHQPGEVWIAVVVSGSGAGRAATVASRRLDLAGGRQEVRSQTVARLLDYIVAIVGH